MIIKLLSALWGVQLTVEYLLWHDVGLIQFSIWLVITVGWAIVLIVSDLAQGFRSKWQRKPIGIITVCILLITSYITPYGPEIGAYSKMLRHEDEYSEIVSDVLSGSKIACQRPCVIDEGPPLMIVFSWGGLTDNWGGICYDQSGVLLEAKKSDMESLRDLFGGDLISVVHLWDNWFYCGFT